MKPSTHNVMGSTALKGSLALATLALLASTDFGAALAQTYTITDLGALGGEESRAHGINNFGQVVGSAVNGRQYNAVMLNSLHFRN